jgi:membrane fusion protein (multidrug efflux system)
MRGDKKDTRGESLSKDQPVADQPDASPDSNGDAANTPDDQNKNGSPAEGHVPARKPGLRRRRRFIIIGASALVLIAIAGTIYWLYARQYESTDDAFIDGDIVQISPKVSAYVTRVAVSGNQFVHKGDLLVELNPADYEVKLEQAKAQLQAAQSQRGQALANVNLTRVSTRAAQSQAVSNVQTTKGAVTQTKFGAESQQSRVKQAQSAVTTARANLAQVRAQTGQAESNLKLAQIEYDRRLALFDRGDISRQSLDQALNALQTAQSQLDSIHRQIDAAQSRVNEADANVATALREYQQALAQVDVTRSQVNESQGRLEDANAAPERIDVSQSQVETAEASQATAEAAIREAELELSYTKIYAPEDGYVTRKTVEEGQLVSVGTPLMAISQSDEVWVVANFKETQLENMRVGQTAYITVDAYPNKTFRGKVESLQAGTGSRFSLLPAENATGNFVKVVQRVPVKIVFDQKPPDNLLLAPGMSVEPSVKVR